ncbi:emerin 1-like isoform X2 [Biomphalaria pfeifferi]|uniref:Emerin 1-like isoform X2 n=1 Tax=Biomphalaria pfeifferi TaxID=112525 RepID=A0AAD8EYU2_BIOPF|nr:emerin 1-like isoform X2 [Biomphalaria pfeifferi]
MAPIINFSNLTDMELSQMLKDYGVIVGPINVATRKTYERKLLKLKTGQESPSSQRYTPVDDDEDDDDNEVEIRQPIKHSPFKMDYSQARQRKEISETYSSSSSSRVESRPSLSTSARTTTSYVPAASEQQEHYHDKRRENVSSVSGIPLWVKIVFIAVILVLVFLLYTNMESAAQSEIPSIANTVEV